MKNILVVFGGKSFEHDISIITTLLLVNRSEGSKYNFLPLYISRQNEWFFVDKKHLCGDNFKNFDGKNGKFKRAFFGENKTIVVRGKITKTTYHFDAVLNCCHGGIGENGSLTGLFSCLNVPISSFGLTGMAVSMDKLVSKYAFKGMKLPVIDFTSFTKDEAERNIEVVINRAEKLGYPLILKPCNLGSSIGISIAKNKEELIEAINVAIKFDKTILVEKALLNFEEYNVACMKYQKATLVSDVDKPIKHDEILSFKDKYIGSGEKTQKSRKMKGGAYLEKKEFEKIDKKLEGKLKSLAKTVYEKLGLGGVARVDFIVFCGKIFLNEVNTVPGSLGYYFFCPSVFKNIGEFLDAIIDESIAQKNEEADVDNNLVTRLF